MVVSLVGAGVVKENTAAATTLVVAYPTGIIAGDVLVLIVSTNATAAPPAQTGWTTAAALASTGNTTLPALSVGYRVAAGTESGTSYTATTASTVSIGEILAFRGVDTTTPLDVAASTLDRSTAAATDVIPGITTTTAGAALVYANAVNATTGSDNPPTAPGTFVETMDRSAGTRLASAGYLIWSGVGATGTVTVDHSTVSARSVAALLALRPAATVRTRTQSKWR